MKVLKRTGGILLLLAWTRGAPFVAWSLVGWLIMGLTGVVGGAWIASRHGSAGSGFLFALVSCMLARLALAAGGAFASAMAGAGAVRACLVGMMVGFLPLQIFEVVWFYRRTARMQAVGVEQSRSGVSNERGEYRG